MTGGELESFCLALPKIELHVHLEGSMRPATLLALARRHGVRLPADDEAGIAAWFRFRDFDDFVEVYLTCCRCLRDPEDFQLLVSDFLAEQARQNVGYSEVHFTVGTHVANGANGGELADALWQAITEGERRWGVAMRLVPDIVRNLGPAAAEVPLAWALAGRQRGVVALGLSGSERFAAEPFREHFAAARGGGLRTVAHAGEQAGAESIRATLAACSPERIGHGIAAVADPELVETLRREGPPLEVCPSSNVALGLVPSLAEHPFERLRRAGVPLSVNSDDPPLFATTLTREYRRLAECFGYDAPTLAGLARGALSQAFLDAGARRRLEVWMRSGFTALGVEYDDVAPALTDR
jgi:adenosine deaminase